MDIATSESQKKDSYINSVAILQHYKDTILMTKEKSLSTNSIKVIIAFLLRYEPFYSGYH